MQLPVSSIILKFLQGSNQNNLLQIFVYNQIIKSPIEENNKYIYYDGHWSPFNTDSGNPDYGIVFTSTYGIINYYVKVIKKTFENTLITNDDL